MNTKFRVLLLSMSVIIVVSGNICAQVTIGSNTPPQKAALLQIKDQEAISDGGITSSTGGFLLPRVNLTLRTELHPFYTSGATDYTGVARDKAKLDHIGLIVYNLNPVEEENLETGVYKWDGTKWTQIMETPSMAKVSVDDCSKIRVNGKYYKGVGLNASNTISIPLTVTQEGNYTILATTTNGFQFQASGVFKSEGSYTVTLTGLGAPVNTTNPAPDGTPVIFTCNNEPIVCNDVRVPVGSTQISYDISCGDIVVNGSFNKGESLDGSQSITIPIIVENTGTLTITTNTNNGFYFTGSQAIDESTTSVTIPAIGIPTNAGTFMFNFSTNGANVTSCIFNIQVESTLGTFANPAKSCYTILNEDPTKPDGEYWIQQSEGSTAPIKTLCDMTHGGYTLIWSYSEYSSKYLYGTNTTMHLGSDVSLREDKPRNVVDTEAGEIQYEDYRLANATMINAKRGDVNSYRVRIAYDPRDINDAWGEDNYFQSQPASKTYDFLSTTSTGALYTWNGSDIAVTGKYFGITYVQNTANTTVAYGSYTNTGLCNATYYATPSYGNHFDVNYRIAVSTATKFTALLPKHDAPEDRESYQFNPVDINNLFGYQAEDDINHHWGKCGAASDDYDFYPALSTTGGSSMRRCGATYRVPHDFNWNANASPARYEGRYLQWWVK